MTSTKNDDFSTQGARLRFALNARNKSQADAAKMVLVTPGQISKWIKDQNALTGMAAVAFEYALGFNHSWLLTGEGNKEVERQFVPDDLKELAALWPQLSEKQRQYVLGVVQGMLAAEGK